jgi:hypothetical protein
MAKRRTGKQDEVMLIPFLDILCSLIGVLILIIVMVCAAQLQKIKGRTKEDVQRAQRYQSLLYKQKELAKTISSLKGQVNSAERRVKELTSKEQSIEELHKRIDSSSDAARIRKQKAAELQRDIDYYLKQIKTLTESKPALQAEIDRLNKLLAERKKKPDDRLTPLLVRPSGSGTARNQQLFFVEATGAGIVVHKSKTDQLRVASASVGVDKDYDAFLTKVASTKNAALIFLVRRDGWRSYTRAAGWAEQQFRLNTGKLPLPGDGPVDLSSFDKSATKK